MSRIFVFVLILIFSPELRVYLCGANVVSFFESQHFGGFKVSINPSKCSNVPLNNVGSISTRDQCARVYNGLNCTGSSVSVSPNFQVSNVFTAWNKRRVVARSVGPCPDACSRETYDGPIQEIGRVKIFNGVAYKGWTKEISVVGCTKLSDEYADKVVSINTYNKCIQLFNTADCNIGNDSVHTIKLVPGTPFHHNLYLWQFPEVKAISYCSYKCSKNTSLPIFTKNQAIIYDHKNFRGRYILLNVSTECTTISDIWTGMLASIKISEETCVALFDRENCVGDDFNVHFSTSEFSTFGFSGSKKSLRLCQSNFKKPKVALNKTDTENSLATNRPNEVTTNLPMFTLPSSSPDSAINNTTEQVDMYSPGFEISTVQICLIIAGLIFTLVLLIVMGMICKGKCLACRREVDMLTEKEILSFLAGTNPGIVKINKECDTTLKDCPTEILAQRRPYNNNYDIEESTIEYDTGDILQKGEFNVTYQGTLSSSTQKESSNITFNYTKRPVIIKTANVLAGLRGLRFLMKEVKVMMYVGQHTNVGQMVGCCTEKLRQGKLLVLMEICQGGPLETYLHTHADSFTNFVVKGKLLVPQLKSMKPEDTAEFQVDSSFNTIQLIEWCIGVSRGMQFLSDAKLVHSDLASRNVLLTDRLQAKISDYGLCRQLYNYSRYSKTQKEPWRWMAIESLKQLEFSAKTDVWNYGVFCWEVFTLGEIPYKNVRTKDAFMYDLIKGLRLSKPKYCTNELYILMLKCWESDPCERPSFTEISNEVQEFLGLQQNA